MFAKWCYRIAVGFLYIAIIGIGIMAFGHNYSVGGGIIAICILMAILTAVLPIIL